MGNTKEHKAFKLEGEVFQWYKKIMEFIRDVRKYQDTIIYDPENSPSDTQILYDILEKFFFCSSGTTHNYWGRKSTNKPFSDENAKDFIVKVDEILSTEVPALIEKLELECSTIIAGEDLAVIRRKLKRLSDLSDIQELFSLFEAYMLEAFPMLEIQLSDRYKNKFISVYKFLVTPQRRMESPQQATIQVLFPQENQFESNLRALGNSLWVIDWYDIDEDYVNFFWRFLVLIIPNPQKPFEFDCKIYDKYLNTIYDCEGRCVGIYFNINSKFSSVISFNIGLETTRNNSIDGENGPIKFFNRMCLSGSIHLKTKLLNDKNRIITIDKKKQITLVRCTEISVENHNAIFDSSKNTIIHSFTSVPRLIERNDIDMLKTFHVLQDLNSILYHHYDPFLIFDSFRKTVDSNSALISEYKEQLFKEPRITNDILAMSSEVAQEFFIEYFNLPIKWKRVAADKPPLFSGEDWGWDIVYI